MLLMVKSTTVTVTDKRVYGKTMFGVRVDIPLDSISSVGIGILDTIIVASSSGRLSFIGIKNREEIHRTITNLLQKRTKNSLHDDSIDNIIKLKTLLEQGVISQEEFDAKKKQILGF